MRANVDRDSSRAAREEDLSTLRRRQAISHIRCWLGNPPVEIVVSLVTVAGPPWCPTTPAGGYAHWMLAVKTRACLGVMMGTVGVAHRARHG